MKRFLTSLGIFALASVTLLTGAANPASAKEDCAKVGASYEFAIPEYASPLPCGFSAVIEPDTYDDSDTAITTDIAYDMNLADMYIRASLEVKSHPRSKENNRAFDVYQNLAKEIIATNIIATALPPTYSPKTDTYESDAIGKLQQIIGALYEGDLTHQEFDAYRQTIYFHVAWSIFQRDRIGGFYDFIDGQYGILKYAKYLPADPKDIIKDAKKVLDPYMDILDDSEGFVNWVVLSEVSDDYMQKLYNASLVSSVGGGGIVPDDGTNHFGESVVIGDYEVSVNPPTNRKFGDFELQLFEIVFTNNSAEPFTIPGAQFQAYDGEEWVWGTTSIDGWDVTALDPSIQAFDRSLPGDPSIIPSGIMTTGVIIFESKDAENLHISLQMPDGSKTVWVP